MAVMFAALLFLLVVQPSPGAVAPTGAGTIAMVRQDSAAADTTSNPGQSVKEAAGTLRGLWRGFLRLVPKIVIALGVLLIAWVVIAVLGRVLRIALRNFSQAEAVRALLGLGIWVFAIGIAMSILAGDVRTLIGSFGLIGLALSWALQAPIESFTGWFLNSFRSYYRVGDRIAVREVFGDVYRIDILTTTVWEAGGPGKSVQAAQPTGALITFPNSEVLRANIVNFTRDFPYVWDEVAFGIANESDLPYSVGVARRVAGQVVGEAMTRPANQYREMLQRVGLPWDVSLEPQVYLSLGESWTVLTVRYLVAARERRMWSSRLIEIMSTEFAKPEHSGKILAGFPQTTVHVVQPVRISNPQDPVKSTP